MRFLAFIRHRLGSEPREVHEDLTHEAMVRLLRVMRREPVVHLEGLMNRIADNVVGDFLRSRQRWRKLLKPVDGDTPDVADPSPSPEDSADPSARLRFVVLEFFTTEHAPCAELARAFFAGTSWKDLAEREGLHHNTLIKRWSRCVERLREAARDDDDNPILGWTRD